MLEGRGQSVNANSYWNRRDGKKAVRRVGQTRKRDGNEAAIVDALRQVGARVIRISEPGAPDLLVLFHGDLVLMEAKTAKGTLTKAQARRSAEGWPVYLVRSPTDALRAIGVIHG